MCVRRLCCESWAWRAETVTLQRTRDDGPMIVVTHWHTSHTRSHYQQAGSIYISFHFGFPLFSFYFVKETESREIQPFGVLLCLYIYYRADAAIYYVIIVYITSCSRGDYVSVCPIYTFLFILCIYNNTSECRVHFLIEKTCFFIHWEVCDADMVAHKVVMFFVSFCVCVCVCVCEELGYWFESATIDWRHHLFAPFCWSCRGTYQSFALISRSSSAASTRLIYISLRACFVLYI